jgi:hypothetical protein
MSAGASTPVPFTRLLSCRFSLMSSLGYRKCMSASPRV